MTPGARVSAAIEILDTMTNGGLAAEQALTRWGRASRFAGSKGRAAVRDHVFDVLRNRAMAAHLGQGETGRALMIGLLRLQGVALAPLFNAQGHAPSLLSEQEQITPLAATETNVLWNLPEWLIPLFQGSLGPAAQQAAIALQARAPICLRVNQALATLDQASQSLAGEGIITRPTPVAPSALIVSEGARKIRNSAAYTRGWVELQDAASQGITADLLQTGKMLDYCAGGGGKALALAMAAGRDVYAHDIDPRRMSDLPARAARAQAQVTLLAPEAIATQAPFDMVLCDVPCSGSGAWRRAPEGKWTLTPDRLAELTALQDQILDQTLEFVTEGGILAYATCSLLRIENEDRIEGFLARHRGWICTQQRRFNIDAEADGFFVAQLARA